MTSIFTIAGGLVGFTVFGLRGMIFGLLIGHALDFVATVQIGRGQSRRQTRAEVGQNLELLLRTLATTCGRLGSIDAPITSAQLSAFRKALLPFQMRSRFEHECLRLFTLGASAPGQAPHTPLGFHESVIQLANLTQRTTVPPQAIFDILKASVSAQPSSKTLRALAIAAELMGVGEQPDHHSSNGSYSSDSNGNNGRSDPESDPYSILGCQRSDDLNSIKRRYHELLKEYHPDQIQSLQLPSGFIQFANEQVRRLTNAYQSIVSEKAPSA